MVLSNLGLHVTHTVLTRAHSIDVIDWLTKNVGEARRTLPTGDDASDMRGHGWSMKRMASPDSPDYYWRITIDDSRLALLAALRWSSR